jgi:tRNA-dihydrouridine synthase B
MNLLDNCEAQLAAVGQFFDGLGDRMDRMPAGMGGEEDGLEPVVNNDNNKERTAA